MGSESTPEPVTLVYKTITTSSPDAGGEPSAIPLRLDVYLPDSHLNGAPASEGSNIEVPAVVYFHGGGLVVGDRKSWFPEWLRRRLSEQGVAVLSADHQLMPPSTGHEILEDIQALFAYIRKDLNSDLVEAAGDPKLKIDADAIAVAGSSAGGLCTYLCAMHLSPKPKVLLSVYGQAGECLNDHLLEPKATAWVPGRSFLNPSDFAEFIFPQSMSLPITAESPVNQYPPPDPTTGDASTKRTHLTGLYYQLGEWLDYYTGDHTLSRRLRQLRPSQASPSIELPSIDPIKAREVIGENNIGLFPQFGVAGDWPPAFFLHGSEDYQVSVHQSQHLVEKLKDVGVEYKLVVVEGKGHGFDYAPTAEGEFGGLFDEATAFLVRNLQK